MKALCLRFHRRIIIKNFGSCKNLLIWAFSVLVTVLLLDHFVFNPKRITYMKVVKDEAQKDSVSSTKNLSCNQAESCPSGQSSFYILSSNDRQSQPTICFNGLFIFSPSKGNGHRGFNLANINGKTLQVDDVRTFDTYEDDTALERYLRMGIDDSNIVLIATADEASLHLSESSRKLLGSFGSEEIKSLQFRDSFVMVGQRNQVSPVQAVEQLVKRMEGESFAQTASVQGCMPYPMKPREGGGEKPKEEELPLKDLVKLGDFSPNCGMEKACPDGQYAVRLYTGQRNEILPSICFKGRIVVAKDLNNAGRGVMVVVVNVKSGVVVKVARFDTYDSKKESEKLVALLDSVKPGEIILSLVHDEAQTGLDQNARAKMSTFGSSFFKKLEFRNVWTFVGRPAISGFSPYEDLEQSERSKWPFSIDHKFCLDKDFQGTQAGVDLSLKKNMAKREFCQRWDGYEEFCSVENIDKQETPALQLEDSMKDNSIYDVPIMLVAGLSQVSLLNQLLALFQNPGVKKEKIKVMYDEKFEESEQIGKVLEVESVKLPSSAKYITIMHTALEQIWKQFPDAEYVIVLEEEVLPTCDFLYFLGQCLEALKEDSTLAGVSAFNENGFEGLSAEATLVYRGSTFPGFGLLLKKSFYKDHMENKISECCSNRSWFGWKLPAGVEMLYPDVSRVSRRTFLGLTTYPMFIKEYLNSPRANHSSRVFTKLGGVNELVKAGYNKEMNSLLSKASTISNEHLVACVKQNVKPALTRGTTYAVYFKSYTKGAQASSGDNRMEDDQVLMKLAKCFGLTYAEHTHVRGLHEGSLRLQTMKSEVILVSDSSPYYKNRLMSLEPFDMDLLH